MAITKQRLTFDDWLALPDDGRHYELLNGELIEMPPPTANHARLVTVLGEWLRRAERAGHGIAIVGPVAVLLDATMRRENAPEPDVLFVGKDRAHIVTAVAVEGVPDLVIEILSPSHRDGDLPGGAKWKLYEQSAVPAYWAVDSAARVVHQYTLHATGYGEPISIRAGSVLSSPLFPGITLPVADLFSVLRDPEPPATPHAERPR